MIAPPAYPMMLLGNVGEGQKVRERTRHRHGRVDGHIAQHVCEEIERAGLARVRSLGDAAHPFDAIEQRLSFVRSQRFAEQFTEQVDVVAKRFVWVRIHVQRCFASVVPRPR